MALQYRLHAGACVLYALEFFCLSIAKLLVLDRMMDFVLAAAAITAHRRWAAGGRGVIAGVVAGNAVGLCGSVTAAVHWQQAAGYATAASAAFASNGSSAPALQLQALAWLLEVAAQGVTQRPTRLTKSRPTTTAAAHRPQP